MGKPGRSGGKQKYPWRDMKVNQQRVVSGDHRLIRSAACMWSKAHGTKFSTHTIECEIIVKRIR